MAETETVEEYICSDDIEAVEEEIRKFVRAKLNTTTRVIIDRKYTNGAWRVDIHSPAGGHEYGRAGFVVYSFPGCCKYAILSQVFTRGDLNGIGLVKFLLDYAEKMGVRDFEVDTLIATGTDEHNETMINIIEKAGWKQIHEGENGNTGNLVRMFAKLLPVLDEEEEWPNETTY